MPSHRIAARAFIGSGLVLASVLVFLFGVSACGGGSPPPRSAGSASGGSAHASRTTTPGASSASLGDSALGPAAADAARSEDWPRAESLYRELARRQPRNADAKRGLGVALLRQHKDQDAVTALQDCLRLSDDAHVRLDLASAFAGLDRYPSALPHLRKAVQLAPREPAAWTQLAVALVKVDKPDGAAEVLSDARRACPTCASDDGFNRVTDDVARAFATKAAQQIGAADPSGARKSLALATALRPNLPEANLASGKVARAEGDKKAAANAYRKAVEALPDAKADSGATARLELATLLMSDGNGGEAIKLAEQVIAVRSDDGVALDTLGRACDATRNVDCARKAYGKLVTLPARDATAQGALDHAKHRMKELKVQGRRK